MSDYLLDEVEALRKHIQYLEAKLNEQTLDILERIKNAYYSGYQDGQNNTLTPDKDE